MQRSPNNISASRTRADRVPRSSVRKIAEDVSFLVALFGIAVLMACEGSPFGQGTGPGSIVITIQPGSATLFLGQTQQFRAIVTGTSNTNVTWSVNGVAGGNATVGSISIGGLYTAPSILPANGTVTVTAVSVASDQASSSVGVTLMDDVAVSVSPASANVPAAGAQVFAATVTGTGSPSTAVTWSVNGIAGGNSTVGTIVANGSNGATYTAPAVPPTPATVTVTATSVADNTKTGSASVTITCATDSISPTSANVPLGQTQNFAASLCATGGAPTVWDVNGIAGGNTTVGTIASSGAGAGNTAVYTAPSDLPSPTLVTIHATAGNAIAVANVTVVSQRVTFAANVANTPDSAVTWTVNGILNGNSSFGEICVTASNPCVSPNGPAASAVDYLAPASVPVANPVTVAATSKADPSQSGSALVTVAGQTGPIAVTVSPLYPFVAPSGAQASTVQFFADVTNTGNTNVTWSVQSAVIGQGCGGAACGSVDANGMYTAPTTAPSPNAISVVATSVADSTKSASATVAITSGPAIEAVLPSSVMAGAVESFPFEIEGANFVAGSGSSASVILLNGKPRATTCATAMTCATALNPADVQSAATVSVQVQNPGAPGALSNPVPFVIVPFDVSVDTIALTQALPAAASEDIVVVDPTTAAASSPINVDFIGFLAGGNNCGVQGSPLTVTRPASGSDVVSLCVHGNGLDPTFTYAFTGPGGGDIGVVASGITGLFPNMIELDLTISTATLPGVRTLLITTLNNDHGVATGMLEVK
jgi:hypothetical protein